MKALVKSRGGSLSFVRHPSETRGGYPYYCLEWAQSSSPRPSQYFVWHNEVHWLFRGLAALATRLDISRFRTDGLHPLLAHLGPSGGPVWFAQVQSGEVHLTLRRYKDTWKGNDGEKNHTRYFVFERIGKYPIQIRLPASFVRSGELGAFARQCLEEWEKETQRIKQSLSTQSAQLDALSSSAFYRQVAVRVRMKNEFRQMLAFPGMPTEQVDVSVLREPALVATLRACEQTRTPEEVSAELGQTLDSRAVFEMLAWTQRYAPEVLRTGYILTPMEHRKSVAVKDLKVYAADPLFSALHWVRPDDSTGPERLVIPPQCTEPQMLAARKKELSTAFLSTAFGQAALPSPEWARTISGFLRPPPTLRIHRWRVLQMMVLAAGLAGNLPGGLDDEPLLDLQRLALLTHDVTHLFGVDAGTDIRSLTEAAHHRWRDVLQSHADPLPLSDLPKRPES